MMSHKSLPTPSDKKSKACCGHMLDATNVLDVFAVVMLLFQLLAKCSSAALSYKRFVNKHL